MIVTTECKTHLRRMQAASVDALVTDPPYGLSFMGQDWDKTLPDVEIWREVYRVLKPGAHGLVFGATRLWHRLAVDLETAGFEMRDTLMWLYGSGFPKSLDVAKAIDRQRLDREETLEVTAWIKEARTAAGVTNRQIDAAFGTNGMAGHWTTAGSQPQVPKLDQVERLLEVLGNPTVPPRIRELINLLNARKFKPGPDFAKRQVITKKMGVDTTKTRIGCPGNAHGGSKGAQREFDVTRAGSPRSKPWEGWGTALKPAWEPILLVRKPFNGPVASNVLSHGTGALNIDASRVGDEEMTVGESTGEVDHNAKTRAFGTHTKRVVVGTKRGRWPSNLLLDQVAAARLGDKARFFYCGKATNADRGEGNDHPTVKPTDLMRYLVRLVTPSGGLVLDITICMVQATLNPTGRVL